jgi:aspartate/methionine/tyrosine aminotransferase
VLSGPDAPEVIRPDGAFYLFINVGDTADGGDDPGSRFAARLLEEHSVAVVPGTAFRTPGWIRLSYAARLEDVVEGVRRVVALRRTMRD